MTPVYHPGNTFFGVAAATFTLKGVSDYLSRLETLEDLEVGCGSMRVDARFCFRKGWVLS